jgi:hypothetical protein
MMTHKTHKAKITFGTLMLFLALGCQLSEGGGGSTEIALSIPHKRLITNSTPVENICYVDVEKYNPLNAKDYIFTANADTAETQFFNYVVLGFSYLVKNERGYTYLELTPALQYILANSKTYIKPLRQKGIRVLIEVRSGNYADDQDGAGLGFGTLDMAAINELTKELKLIVNRYGIDGFEFNDTGGGQRAYPPLTRNLTQFQSDTPLYPNGLFINDDGFPLTDAEIIEKLWIEGGSNFVNLIQRTNEALKESYTNTYSDGSTDNAEVVRAILVRNTGHGGHLLSDVRMAYMPDAYSGADVKVITNLEYIVNAFVPDENASFPPHAALWNEDQKDIVGENEDDRYAPFAVDLGDQKDADTARLWARSFLLKDPAGSTTDNDNQNRYGALYFTNLPPVSEVKSVTNLAYLSYFSMTLFGRSVRLADAPGAGDYKKTW